MEKSQFLMGKSPISMAIFNSYGSYGSLPEGDPMSFPACNICCCCCCCVTGDCVPREAAPTRGSVREGRWSLVRSWQWLAVREIKIWYDMRHDIHTYIHTHISYIYIWCICLYIHLIIYAIAYSLHLASFRKKYKASYNVYTYIYIYIYINIYIQYIFIHSYFTDIGATSILNEENSIPCHCWCYKHVGHQICLNKMPN